MSLSARHVLRPACYITVPPSTHHSPVVTEADEHMEPTTASDNSQTTQALINGTEYTQDQYVLLTLSV